MHLALRLLGVEPGDEVVASSMTFIGSVSPVTFLGGGPVFIDSDRTSWNMDPDLLADELEACKKREKLPRAVIPTDLYGQCANYDRIYEICSRYDVPVVVDAAEALGAKYKFATPEKYASHFTGQADTHRQPQTNRDFSSKDNLNEYRHAGVGARAAIYSFNGNKIITTSGGGMLASDDEEFIEKARFFSQQARDLAPHYEHSQIGYNYRMSNILAAIGRGQLQVLDERVKRKREIFDYYEKALGDVAGIEFMPEAPYGKCSRWLTVILITPEEFGADREEVRIALEGENIESRPVWKPMHMQPVFDCESATPEKYASHFTGQADERRPTQIFSSRTSRGKNSRRFEEKLPKKRIKARVIGGEVAEDLFNRGLCLPSGTAMTEGDLDRVVSTLLKCRKQ
jgi:dTDP-4-amino-4,6-dideoxygalactose transaminase